MIVHVMAGKFPRDQQIGADELICDVDCPAYEPGPDVLVIYHQASKFLGGDRYRCRACGEDSGE